MPGEFLAQMQTIHLSAILLALGAADWTSFRRHTNIYGLVLLIGEWLVSRVDHVVAHIQRCVVVTCSIGFSLIMPLIDHFF